jgi:hypothetical protein
VLFVTGSGYKGHIGDNGPGGAFKKEPCKGHFVVNSLNSFRRTLAHLTSSAVGFRRT